MEKSAGLETLDCGEISGALVETPEVGDGEKPSSQPTSPRNDRW
jgi:hypothetical protein